MLRSVSRALRLRASARFPRPALLGLALPVLLAACTDTGTSPEPRGNPALPSPGSARIAELTCRVDVRARTVACGDAPAASGAGRGDLIVGGQNTYVRLASSNTFVTDVADPTAQDTFSFDATVENLIPQPLGTADGTTGDAAGVRVFLPADPRTTSGTGVVRVANADGYDAFTNVNQAYFQYAGPLAENATSAATRWKLAFDPGVVSFSFKAYVSAVVQYPAGWVDVGYGTLTSTLAPGASGQAVASVRNQVGDVLSEDVSWSASSVAVVVGSTGTVTAGQCGGAAAVTASTPTRPARLGVAVTVQAPSFSGFSPNPYAAGGSTISRTASLSATFSYCTRAIGPETFVVRGSQGSPSLLGGSYTGVGTRTGTFSHTGSFFAGEEVEVSLTSALASAVRVARFRTATGAASGAYGGKVDIATGSSPYSVAAGDLNGDGRLDLAVVNQGSNTVSVLLRNAGNTGYAAKSDFGTGSGPSSVAMGDVNRDGRVDLVVTNYFDNTVSVLLRNAANTGYDARADYATGSAPLSVALGDMNGDGQVDLAVANYNSATVSVLLRNAANTGYEAGVSLPTGTQPQSVAVGDLNGDGLLDLAVASQNTGTVSVLLRNAANTFYDAKLSYSTGLIPRAVAVGDLNGDGRLDLAVANYNSANVSVLLRNTTNDGFGLLNYAAGTNPQSVAVGDLNGDGRLDLAVANYGSSTLSVLLRNSSGTFNAKVDYATGTNPRSVVIGDLNNDGRLDLAVANTTSANVSMLNGGP